MSRITLNNYEAYLLDFSEGKLNAEDIRQLDEFFKIYPELDLRSETKELPELSILDESFEEKAGLLKTEVYLEDERVLSYLENILTSEETSVFENELTTNAEL